METSSSVRFVLQLASQEAMASQHSDIAPEHLFVAVLKFSGLDIDKIKDVVSKPDTARELTEDLNAVRDVIREKSIRCSEVCHGLIAEIGKGNACFTGGIMHRSPDCKALFDTALKLARDSNSNRMSPVHLFNAMLLSPTKAMTRALAAQGSISKPTNLTNLKKSNRAACAPSNPVEATSCTIEAKALIQALAHPSCKSVIIITRNVSIVHNIVTQTAKKLAQGDCPDLLKRKRIVDVSHLVTDAELDKALIDTSVEKGIILYTPLITSIEHYDRQDHWVKQLERVLEEKTVQSISAASAATYNDLIKRSSVWKKRVHPIWIRDKDNQEIPKAL